MPDACADLLEKLSRLKMQIAGLETGAGSAEDAVLTPVGAIILGLRAEIEQVEAGILALLRDECG